MESENVIRAQCCSTIKTFRHSEARVMRAQQLFSMNDEALPLTFSDGVIGKRNKKHYSTLFKRH